jgi:hypothetical protein
MGYCAQHFNPKYDVCLRCHKKFLVSNHEVPADEVVCPFCVRQKEIEVLSSGITKKVKTKRVWSVK